MIIQGFTTESDQALLSRIETQLKRRFAVGTQASFILYTS